jgi:ribosomal protein L37AE/L43A
MDTCPLCGRPREWSESFKSWSCRPCRPSFFRVTRDPNGEPLIDFAMTERDYDEEVQSRFAA